MTFGRSFRLLLAVLALGLLAVACEADPDEEVADDPDEEAPEAEDPDDGEISLTYAFFAPEGTFPAVQMEEWADRLEERTDGQVTVDTFPGGTLLGAEDMYDGVAEGVADIGLGSPGYDVGRFPLSSGIALPVGFPNSTVASLAFWELLEEYQPAELYDDFKLLTAFTTEPGHAQTTEPVESLEDFEGLTIRAGGSGVPALEALGADAVGMPMPEVPEAVETGVIDGTLTSREVLQDFALAENLGYVTEHPTVVVSFAAVMRQDDFDALPADVQEEIEALGPEMAEWTGQYHDTQNVEAALDWAQSEHGLEIIQLDEAEAARWDEALEPLIDDWLAQAEEAGLPGEEFLDRMIELRDELAEEHG